LFVFPGILSIAPTNIHAQSGTYVVQVQDVLSIAFWEYPELNAKVRVERDGGIDLPLVGKLTAAGLSINVLRQKIISQMSLYNRIVTQLNIDVLEYGSNIVYVTGQVRNPGRFSFEVIPNLWEILLRAGGPLESASLSQIFVVRAEEGGKVYTIDLAEALQNASLDQLMAIRPGDTIQVQTIAEPGQLQASSPLAKAKLIYIFGAVGRQGAHRYQAGANLMEVIGNAGGPARNANLKKVKHISVANGTSSIAVVNLEKYMDITVPQPMPIGPGDFIIIPTKSSLGNRLLNIVITTTVTSVLGTILFVTLRK